MTRALVIQLVEALEKLSDTEQTYAALDKAEATASLALRSLADQVEALQPALETERAAANLYAKQVAHWIEKHDALLAQQLEVAESYDALKDAARLALDTLIEIRDNSFSWDSEYDKVVKSLKAVL